MALLERVSTLIRANLNDLIDKAENPEKLIKQIILDMENQLLQVKTQVAIAIADQHLLEKKQKENQEKIAEWDRKAEYAVTKKQDDLARAAIERSLHYKQLTESFVQQVSDQHLQVETLKTAFSKLQQKLEDAHAKMGDHSKVATFDRMKQKVMRNEAISQAKTELMADSHASIEDRFAQMEKEDEIDRILNELKAK